MRGGYGLRLAWMSKECEQPKNLRSARWEAGQTQRLTKGFFWCRVVCTHTYIHTHT